MINKSIGLFLLVFITTEVKADIPLNYKPKNDTLNFSVSAPPAVLLVQNNQGQKTGADFSLPVNQVGRQGTVSSGLQGIPLSELEQQNIASNDPQNLGQAQSFTSWVVHVWDGGNQTYTVSLLGLENGMADLEVLGTHLINGKMDGSPVYSQLNVFVEKNQIRNINISFNPVLKKVTPQLIVGNGDLLIDVQTACQLGQITSPLACRFLTDEAKLIQTALEKNREQEAEDLTWVFLHSLGFSRPVGCKDEDHHSEVKQPALGILQEDAKALLDQLEKNPSRPSR